jgi:hypothetical protein
LWTPSNDGPFCSSIVVPDGCGEEKEHCLRHNNNNNSSQKQANKTQTKKVMVVFETHKYLNVKFEQCSMQGMSV